MGTITVNVDSETEEMFRKAVSEEYGKGKGVLGKAIGEAMKKWVDEQRFKVIRERQIALLKKGIDFGKTGSKFSRRELYDEVISHRTKY
jgi:hypothetical protein